MHGRARPSCQAERTDRTMADSMVDLTRPAAWYPAWESAGHDWHGHAARAVLLCEPTLPGRQLDPPPAIRAALRPDSGAQCCPFLLLPRHACLFTVSSFGCFCSSSPCKSHHAPVLCWSCGFCFYAFFFFRLSQWILLYLTNDVVTHFLCTDRRVCPDLIS